MFTNILVAQYMLLYMYGFMMSYKDGRLYNSASMEDLCLGLNSDALKRNRASEVRDKVRKTTSLTPFQ